MAKVSIYLRVRSEGKTLRARPVWLKNCKLRPLYAFVKGQPEFHPEGVYQLRYRNRGRRCWKNVGPDPNNAQQECRKQEAALEAVAVGLELVAAPEERVSIAAAVVRYLSTVEATKSHMSFIGYRCDLKWLLESCKKQYLDQIVRQDLLDFTGYLRRHGLGDRTVFNRLQSTVTFLRSPGITGLLRNNDWPRFTEKKVTTYGAEELQRLFAACGEEDRLLFQFFLGSGLREAEVMYATWPDLDFASKTFTVRAKRDFGFVFTPKDYGERLIPLPDTLIAALKECRHKNPQARLLFSTPAGKPDGHFLRRLKMVALKAGLNCGHCVNKQGLCCATDPVCKHWELHRFRKTFATLHHEGGVSARTLQEWLGHSSLETTLRYLQVADLRSAKTRLQVNGSFAACL